MSSRSVSSALGGKLGVLLLLLVTVASRAEDNLGEKISSEVRRLFDERRASTVRVEAYDRHGKLSGTGFFADPAGTIYTLSYIVANADEILVIHGDRRIPAKLLLADASQWYRAWSKSIIILPSYRWAIPRDFRWPLQCWRSAFR